MSLGVTCNGFICTARKQALKNHGCTVHAQKRALRKPLDSAKLVFIPPNSTATLHFLPPTLLSVLLHIYHNKCVYRMPLGYDTEDSFMGMHFRITVGGNNYTWAVKKRYLSRDFELENTPQKCFLSF